MEAIELEVHVPVDVALRAGSAKAGATTVTLTDELLGQLSEAERATLAEAYRNERIAPEPGRAGEVLRLQSVDTSPEAVLAALRAVLARYEQGRARNESERQQSIAEGVAAIEEGRAFEPNGHSPTFKVQVLQELAPKHPALATFEKQRTELAARLRREWMENPQSRQRSLRTGTLELEWWAEGDREVLAIINADEKAKRVVDLERSRVEREQEEAKKKATAEERARVADRLRAYALTVPDLEPAAREGYDIIAGTFDHIAELCAAEMRTTEGVKEPVVVIREGSAEWNETSETERPSPRAAAVLAQKSLAERIAKIAAPEGSTIETLRVQRVTMKRNDREVSRTALVVYVNGSYFEHDRVIYGYLE